MQDYILVHSPLTDNERILLINEKSEISIAIAVDLSDLINWDIEKLNDYASEMVGVAALSDIRYEVVGHSNNKVHIKVTGEIEGEF